LLSMAGTWAEAFWKPVGSQQRDMATPGTPLLIAISGLTVVTLALTVWAGPLFELALRAAEQVLQPEQYVRAVLGGLP
jgi:multicomponent Na+:H+ antiporter subunit D